MIPHTRNPGYSPVRVGVVGVGEFGIVHARTAAGVAEAHLAALVDSNENRLKSALSEFPDAPGWTSFGQAVQECDVEAWIIAASTASHVSLAQTVLAAGKSVLLDKPIADNLSEAMTLEPLVSPDSSNLMLGHVVLFNSEYRELLREVRHRGPIVYIDCVRHRPATTLDAYPGESPFHLTMIHDLYLLLVLMNRAEPIRMSAQTHVTPDGRCDLALAQLQWESGALASLSASFLTPPGMAADGFDRMEVFGQGWAARLQPNPRPIEVWDSRARWPFALEVRTEPHAASGMLADQLRCFCRVVRGIEPVPMGATYHDAVQLQRWIEQLQTAASTQSQLQD
ncbi:MAG: Gfo/Idh/MocA family protein [Planctomycetaceae bacterium]